MMSFILRTSLRHCVLSLILVISLPGHCRSLAVAAGSSQDEATLNRLTREYGHAIAAGDIEAMRGFWNPQSPSLASRLRYYRNLFLDTRLEFIEPRVTRLEITGGKAVSTLTADERHLDRKTGGILTTYDVLRGACRSIEWVKTDRWLIQS